jgi:hypothetical protein
MQLTLDLPDTVVALLGDAPERTIYKLIKAHLAPAAPRGRRVSNAERDAAIADKAVAGVTHAAIANEYNLSTIRVSQIVSVGKADALIRNPSASRKPIHNTPTPKPKRVLTPQDIHNIQRMRSEGALTSEMMQVFSISMSELQDALWSAPPTTRTPTPAHTTTTTTHTTPNPTHAFDFDMREITGQL